MSPNTPNQDDLMGNAQAAPGYQNAVDQDILKDFKGALSDKSRSAISTLLANAGVSVGIAAAVAALFALGVYLLQGEFIKSEERTKTAIVAALEKNADVKTLKARLGLNVIGEEIRNRIRANALATRLLGRFANKMDDGHKGTGYALFDHFQTPPTNTDDKTVFLDAIAAYVESQALAAGLHDAILVMFVEDKPRDEIEKVIQEKMSDCIQEQELNNAIVAILLALADDAKRPPTAPVTRDTFDTEKVNVIRGALVKEEIKRLLTAPEEKDMAQTSEVDMRRANGFGFVKTSSPFEGLGNTITTQLTRLSNDRSAL